MEILENYVAVRLFPDTMPIGLPKALVEHIKNGGKFALANWKDYEYLYYMSNGSLFDENGPITLTEDLNARPFYLLYPSHHNWEIR